MLLGENHIGGVVDATYMDGVSDKFSTSSEDGTIRLWDANDYTVYARCHAMTEAHPTCTKFTEEIIISGWTDGKVRAFRVDNQSALWEIDNAHQHGVTTIALSFNQKFLATGGMSGDIRTWEIRSRELISHLKEHTSKVTKIQILPDDIHLISSSRDKSILGWDLKNEKRISNHTQRKGGINSYTISPVNPSQILSIGQERMITYWDMAKSQPEYTLNSSPNPAESDELFTINCSPDGKFFVTGGSLGIIRLWELGTGKCVAEQKGHSAVIECAVFSPDGKQIVTTGQDGLVLVWNVFT